MSYRLTSLLVVAAMCGAGLAPRPASAGFTEGQPAHDPGKDEIWTEGDRVYRQYASNGRIRQIKGPGAGKGSNECGLFGLPGECQTSGSPTSDTPASSANSDIPPSNDNEPGDTKEEPINRARANARRPSTGTASTSRGGTTPPAPPPPPTGREVAEYIVSEASLPAPRVGVAPPAGKAWIVNIAGWVWIEDWLTRPYNGTLEGRTALVTATPIATTFDPGDGTPPIVCPGAGTPWTSTTDSNDPGQCSHRYQRSTNYRKLPATVTVTYQMTWSANDGDSGNAGTRQSPPTPIDLQVDQIVSVGTKGVSRAP